MVSNRDRSSEVRPPIKSSFPFGKSFLPFYSTSIFRRIHFEHDFSLLLLLGGFTIVVDPFHYTSISGSCIFSSSILFCSHFNTRRWLSPRSRKLGQSSNVVITSLVFHPCHRLLFPRSRIVCTISSTFLRLLESGMALGNQWDSAREFSTDNEGKMEKGW